MKSATAMTIFGLLSLMAGVSITLIASFKLSSRAENHQDLTLSKPTGKSI
jgi:Mn2+/Fe2+ NRAMP family transporter